MSDSQDVLSHDVPPTLIACVFANRPKLDPCNVTLEDPLPTEFALRATLKILPSDEYKTLTLPPTAPLVSVTRRLPMTPCPTCPRTDVSDSHVDRSQDVPETRREALYVAKPMLPPNKVTLADPVPPRLLRNTPLTDMVSVECPNVKLPTRRPTLTRTR